ncbi:MAG: peptide MFS transporter [Parachlamydiales bacterium]|nr:peptide MFS transporter [Verrucomicrobiota bacterium]MBX3720125.1 peptide MFS transporter [Candidatus Acheromyda pituitae]
MTKLPLKQPRGLFLLFFTELWERFGFYTLQTIIILYMTKGLLLSDTNAYLLYGTFSSMLYLTPVLGGYLADRYLGFQRAIIVGGVLLIVGYLLTAIPNNQIFFLGLSVIIVANGLFKPNVSSIVGDLYRPGDARRDGGFTIFYMGINIGSLIPPLITGWIVATYGWHAGFLLAAIGMFIGLVTFLLGRKRLRTSGVMPAASPLRDNKESLTFYVLFYGGIVLAVCLFLVLFKFPAETDILLALASVGVVGVVIYLMLKEKKVQRNKMIACLILILISIGFWSLYNQTFTSLMLYADRNMDKQILGITIDAEFTQFFNPFFIVLLSPVLSRLWIWLDNKRSNPSTPMKFSMGVLMMSIGFIVLGLGGRYFSSAGETSAWWLVVSYFFQTIGELLLSPIGLAMITTLSPKHLVGMMMGVWFLTQSAAFAIGGGLATFASVPDKAQPTESLAIYDHAFIIYGAISLVLAIISMLLVPYLKRLIYGPSPMRPIK